MILLRWELLQPVRRNSFAFDFLRLQLKALYCLLDTDGPVAPSIPVSKGEKHEIFTTLIFLICVVTHRTGLYLPEMNMSFLCFRDISSDANSYRVLTQAPTPSFIYNFSRVNFHTWKGDYCGFVGLSYPATGWRPCHKNGSCRPPL
jgi:hypothetical protein